MRGAAFIPATLVILIACSVQAPKVELTDQEEVDRILTLCRLPAGALQLQGRDELRLQPPPTAPYEDVDCLLRELKKSRLGSREMGFVGNEAYS